MFPPTLLFTSTSLALYYFLLIFTNGHHCLKINLCLQFLSLFFLYFKHYMIYLYGGINSQNILGINKKKNKTNAFPILTKII